MYHLLLGNKMSGLVYNLHELIYIVWPVIQNVIWILIPSEVNNSSKAINLCSNGFVDYEIGQKFLRFLDKMKSFCFISILLKILLGNDDLNIRVPEVNTYRFW